MILKGRKVNSGKAKGRAIVSKTPFSFIGEFDPSTGKIISPGHELFGESLKDKIFICPTGKGSSGGPGVAYIAKKQGNLPKAMIIKEIEPVLAAAILTGDIPAVDHLDKDPLKIIETGDYVEIDADKGIVKVVKKT
jgi:predicted aconitase with swiveling domain